MKTLEEILKILEKERDHLKNRFGVKEIGIFGSVRRREQKEVSDIDILVDFFPNYKNFDNYMELKFYLEELLGKKVDLVCKSALKKRLAPLILQETIYV